MAPTATAMATHIATIAQDQFKGEYIKDVPLLDTSKADIQSRLKEYATARGLKQQAIKLDIYGLKDANKKTFAVAVSADYKEPILIFDSEHEHWQPVELADMADRANLRVGSMFGGNNGITPQEFEKVRQIVARKFNSGGVWNGIGDIQPTEGIFNLSGIKWATNELAKNQLYALIHPTIWYEDFPKWTMEKSNTELVNIIQSHIKTIASIVHEKKLFSKPVIVVVNEANGPGDWLLQRLGSDYVDLAFQTARSEFPDALLVYNDYNNHDENANSTDGNRYQNTLQIVQRLKEKNLIDAVGIQMGIDGANPPSEATVTEALKSYGIPVIVTEFGVDLRNVNGTQQERFAKQADIVRAMMRAGLRARVLEFNVLQVGDRISIWNDPAFAYSSPLADRTLFDTQFNPKPAYFAMMGAIFDILSQPQ